MTEKNNDFVPYNETKRLDLRKTPLAYIRTEPDTLAVITYGSHLYGTAGPNSDHDYKVITLPDRGDMLLGKSLKTVRHKFDAEGNKLTEKAKVPAGGWEAEHIPVQKYFADFLDGQTYAMELTFALLTDPMDNYIGDDVSYENSARLLAGERHWSFMKLVNALAGEFMHVNVESMLGFAMKQTFDYVHRAKRLAAALEVRRQVDLAVSMVSTASPRLDTKVQPEGMGELTIMEFVSKGTGLEMRSLMQHEKEVPTLILNGREYMATSPISEFYGAITRLIAKYGERVGSVGEDQVEWKSMAHAVRVYQQALEICRTDMIRYPRTNRAELLAIKNGEVPLEKVKAQLEELDRLTLETITTNKIQYREGLREDAAVYFKGWLNDIYIP